MYRPSLKFSEENGSFTFNLGRKHPGNNSSSMMDQVNQQTTVTGQGHCTVFTQLSLTNQITPQTATLFSGHLQQGDPIPFKVCPAESKEIQFY